MENEHRTKALALWKLNKNEECLPLKGLKASNPIEVVEYATANKIVDKPAFAWRVKEVLCHQQRIISKGKSRYWWATHKFGIRLLHNVEETLRIDKETGANCWASAIEKELRKVKAAWEARDYLMLETYIAGKH